MPHDVPHAIKKAASPSVPHDSGYKLLFSNARLVRDLLTGFVKQSWLDSVDLTTLEPHKGSYVTDELTQRHDDSIWRVRFDGTWVYLYLMIEFQSSDDHFMAVRVVTYTGLLYQDIIRSTGLGQGDKLPPVLPIVLYNGSKRWSGPHELAELIDPMHATLAEFSPRLRYFSCMRRRWRVITPSGIRII
ncbi:Rpn family recombination-promoting nuclease/putative transposase [Paenalcaligenes niemegkensis]|uniref:Rpn family recombination-promoting nuclease/putative transposase n=1 Tax=Paenalcaligenes niemegkensis TaxID=2895469 RepID=UPI001EE91ADA|nr:Rpn family recombination-promoting nuclease/putative transposase [Paenalcaligenes niemegkensis]MCQ9618219.1 Rpn family recombination-promoting nuclease/putative transposase [Paenalcaligenes niemegkensis]